MIIFIIDFLKEKLFWFMFVHHFCPWQLRTFVLFFETKKICFLYCLFFQWKYFSKCLTWLAPDFSTGCHICCWWTPWNFCIVLGMVLAWLWNLKAYPQWYTLFSRIKLTKHSHQLGAKCSDIWAYGGHSYSNHHTKKIEFFKLWFWSELLLNWAAFLNAFQTESNHRISCN